MSLYNAVFGVNPFSRALLKMLGIQEDTIPRYRDCFLNEAGDEIIIYTRTGGGNRDFYESLEECKSNYPEYFDKGEDPTGPWNCDLRKLPGFKYDVDDSYDATYANFHYEIPEAFKGLAPILRDMGASNDPTKQWKAMMEALIKKGEPDVR